MADSRGGATTLAQEYLEAMSAPSARGGDRAGGDDALEAEVIDPEPPGSALERDLMLEAIAKAQVATAARISDMDEREDERARRLEARLEEVLRALDGAPRRRGGARLETAEEPEAAEVRTEPAEGAAKAPASTKLYVAAAVAFMLLAVCVAALALARIGSGGGI